MMRSFFASLTCCVSLCWWAPAFAEQTARIAYISTQPEAVVNARANEIAQEFDRRWPKESAKVTLKFDIWPFELSPSSLNPTPEAMEKNRSMMTSVVQSKPAIIYAAGADAARLAKEFTKTIPIVLGCKCNPGPTSARKLVLNLCSPEANLTGFTRYDVRIISPDAIAACESAAKSSTVKLENLFGVRLDILKNVSEKAVRRVGMIYGEDYDEKKWQYFSRAAEAGVTLVPIRLTQAQIADLAALYKTHNIDAALVLADSFLDQNTSRLVRATRAIAIPTLFPWDEANAGAWMHYGTKVDLAAAAVDYFIPLLKGTAVKDLPVSFPTEYELVVNHEVARQHRWVFPKKFLMIPQASPALR